MLLDGFDGVAIERCAARLAEGELVAFPTETVYGLGARADAAAAVARIYAAKGRPSDHPLIVHLAEPADALLFTSQLPPVAQRLIDAHWPGPLTVIVPRRPGVAGAAAGGQASIGLRCPAHPVAQALLRAARALGVGGVAAPSANRFGRISPSCAAHVQTEFDSSMWVLDGGACQVGIESSIVDCTRGRPVLLRPGGLSSAQLAATAGQPLLERDAAAPRAPGTLESHYAPRAKLRLMSGAQLEAAVQLLNAGLASLAVYSRSRLTGAGGRLRQRRMPEQADMAARELYAALRDLDADGVQLIWVEQPPADPAWDGVRDRLQRAAAC